ncbi:hypothetical protein [Aliidiomarina quisquiliarum]|uniref:hypothetical protein n=1 Tax=Aliidiomarina quisquiliarum TaxID=2938947 RepID=UPI00208F374A|nr:hypothetical protein [Aliidiomarina quisquiliarum]MCO4320492.1 hypothetical protein [Aliidiomarina quisquiliarum]
MIELTQQPVKWQKRFTLASPITGRCMPLHEIASAPLQLGAWGAGVALAPGNQRVYKLPGWECHEVSADRRDWQLVANEQGAVVKIHLRIWPSVPGLPIAFESNDDDTLFVLAPHVFQGAGSCFISMTIPHYPKLSWLPKYGQVTAKLSAPITLYAGAKLPTETP